MEHQADPAPIRIHEQARLVYRMLRYGMQFVDKGAAFYEQKHRQRQISSLKRKAAELGFQLVAA